MMNLSKYYLHGDIFKLRQRSVPGAYKAEGENDQKSEVPWLRQQDNQHTLQQVQAVVHRVLHSVDDPCNIRMGHPASTLPIPSKYVTSPLFFHPLLQNLIDREVRDPQPKSGGDNA